MKKNQLIKEKSDLLIIMEKFMKIFTVFTIVKNKIWNFRLLLMI